MTVRIAFDAVLVRPGCPILQAALGGSIEAASKFHSETWLVGPTSDLKVYECTEQQLDKLVKKAERLHING